VVEVVGAVGVLVTNQIPLLKLFKRADVVRYREDCLLAHLRQKGRLVNHVCNQIG
jgi:hypothetical protein